MFNNQHAFRCRRTLPKYSSILNIAAVSIPSYVGIVLARPRACLDDAWVETGGLKNKQNNRKACIEKSIENSEFMLEELR